jgi:hypothetical protein
MNDNHSDTTTAAAEIQAGVHRGLTGVARLRIAVEMSEMTRDLARTRLRQEHPDWSKWDVDRALLSAVFAPGELPLRLR